MVTDLSKYIDRQACLPAIINALKLYDRRQECGAPNVIGDSAS